MATGLELMDVAVADDETGTRFRIVARAEFIAAERDGVPIPDDGRPELELGPPDSNGPGVRAVVLVDPG